jgi:hypothetical protein
MAGDQPFAPVLRAGFFCRIVRPQRPRLRPGRDITPWSPY